MKTVVAVVAAVEAVVAAFNQEKALVGAFSVITNLRMELFEALVSSPRHTGQCGDFTVMDRGSSVLTVEMFVFPTSYTQAPAPAKYEVMLKWDEKVMKSWGQETGSNSQLLVWRKL